MNNAGRVVVSLIMVVVLLIMFPMVLDATHDLQTDDQTQTFAAVATGAGVVEADVVLTYDLFSDTIASVTSVTSDNVADTPAASAWTGATNTLTVDGLAESDTRTLTVTYEYDGLTSYSGMSSLAGLTPLLLWFAVLAVLIGSMVQAVKQRL